MERGYWTEEGFETFGYQGGAMRALIIDALLQGSSRGKRDLDELMRALAAAAPDGPALDDDRLLARLGELQAGPWESLFRDCIEGTDPLPFEALEAVGLTTKVRSRATFELGFEVDGEFRTRVPVVSVVAGSAAEAAGLRPGDLLAGYGFVYGNPDYEVDLQVERGEEQFEIGYFPRREREAPRIEIVDRRRAKAFFR